MPESTSPAAEAGTIAHDMAVQYLSSGDVDAMGTLFLEADILEALKPIFGGKRADAKRVARAAAVYVDVVSSQEGHASYEHNVQHSTIDDFGGTLDTVIVGSGPLTIVDLKTGKWGVAAEGNTQLQCYAILARQLYPETTDVIGCIVQPHFSKVPMIAQFDQHALDQFETRVRIASKSDRRVAGDHCRFCPLKPDCKAYAADGRKFG